MNSELRSEIEGLRKLKIKELQARYREVFGEASPSSNHMHLFRRVAWRLQARAQGGLSERASQRATQLAADVDLRLREDSPGSDVTALVRRKRGRPTKIPDDRKREALAARGGKARAHILYATKYPTPQQVKNVPSILKHYSRTSKPNQG